MSASLRTIVYRIGNQDVVVRSRPRRRSRQRFLKSVTLDGYEMTNKAKDDIFLGVSDTNDLFVSRIMAERDKKFLETFRTDFGVYCTHNDWNKYVRAMQDYRIMQTGDDSGFMFDDDNLCWIYYRVHSTHVTVNLIGDEDFIENNTKRFEQDFDFVTNEIEWLYSNDGQSITIPLQHDRMPVEEMYPFVQGESLEDYYNDFMKSNASILLLIGPPGTGKTTFIRGLLQQTESSAIVSYDAAVLEKDYVFASFIEGDKSVMVLEDADMFLKSRKEGNTMMHKFLNVGDGLVTTRNKKLIFSTNLPSIRDIDPALVRPGRCYDILNFEELTQEDAEKLAARCGVTLNGKKERWSIADVFYNENTKQTKVKSIKTTERKFGFV